MAGQRWSLSLNCRLRKTFLKNMNRAVLSSLRLLAVIALFAPALAWPQAEVPVLADAAGNPQVMFLIDDSGSMNAVMEHPDFDAASAVATNPANDIPSLIWRLESGAAAPSLTHTLRPILIEINDGFADSSTGNLYSTVQFSSAASNHPIALQMTCNNTSGATASCAGPGATTPSRGPNAAYLFGNTGVQGSSIFTVSNLSRVTPGGPYASDSSAHEYLLMSYRREEYNRQTEDWGDVWAKLDAEGFPLMLRTRAYATLGGTVVFNGKTVFLSAGWYRLEYLRWIFYAATPAQLATLPNVNRLRLVKNVVQQLILDNPSVRFGISAFNSTTVSVGVHSGNLQTQWYTPEGNATANGPKIRRGVGTASATLIASLNSMTPRGGTPIANSYIEVLRYFHGETDNDPNFAGTYTSPINSPCDAYFVVLLTDGLPTGETANSVFGAAIADYDNDDAELPANTNSGCSSAVCAEFLDDAAYFAYNTDFSASLAGVQNVRSYAVGLGVTYTLLDQFAEDGGTTHSYFAGTTAEITETLKNIVSLIITSPVAGAGAALAETFGESGKVYRPRFRADTWNGNIDVYEFNSSSGELEFLFDMGDIMEARDLAAEPRTIIAGIDTDFDGNTATTLGFSTANAATLRPYLFKRFADGLEDTALLEPPLADTASNTSAEILIDFVHGKPHEELRVRDRDGDGLTEKLGDIVYSRPVEIGPKNGNYGPMQGYSAFVAGLASQPRILLVGGNDGMLHAFDSLTGEELWAYIPSSQLPYLERMSRTLYNSTYRRSYVDGPIAVEDAYVNGAWRTLAMFGMRAGGSQYTVLDITNRSAPALLWEVNAAGSGGQSWSKPVVVLTGGSGDAPATYNWHMVVGTGEGKTTAGTYIQTFNLNSLTPPAPSIVTISASDPIGTRTSSITAVQDDRDLAVDRLYLGTEEGDIYRVRVTSSVAGWTAAKLYDGTGSQPIVGQPLTVLIDNPQYVTGGSGVAGEKLAVGVYVGTGRFDDRSDISGVGTTTQNILGVFDPVNTASDGYANVLTNVVKANLQNQTPASFTVRRDEDKIYRVPTGKAGFYIDQATSISLAANSYINPVGMVFYEAINLRGGLFFSTFLPHQGACAVGGHGFVQMLNFRTGGGFITDYVSTPDKPFYNGGIPDANGDGNYTAADVTAGIAAGNITAAIDVKVESISLGQTKPYTHSNTLNANDIRLAASGGGILPALASLGDQGAPVAPSILRGAQKVIVQPAYPVPPTVGNPTDGTTGGGGTDLPSESLPPPENLPISIYNLPLDILSFHESTSN